MKNQIKLFVLIGLMLTGTLLKAGEVIPMLVYKINPDDIVALSTGDTVTKLSKSDSEKVLKEINSDGRRFIAICGKDEYIIETYENHETISKIKKDELRKPTHALILVGSDDKKSKLPRVLAWLDKEMNIYHYTFKDAFTADSKKIVKSVLTTKN